MRCFRAVCVFAALVVLSVFPSLTHGQTARVPLPKDQVKLLSQREQMDVREDILRTRLGAPLLAMMKRHSVDVWVVVNEEFNTDPVVPIIVPPIPMVGRRDIFVFVNNGDKIDRYAILRYNEERVGNHYRVMLPPREKIAEELKRIVDERNPKTIALNMGGTRGQQNGLSHDSYQYLVESLGPANEKKFVSAAALLTEFMDTRVSLELEHYRNAVHLTDLITQRALSNEVIVPGKTTVGDVRWWMLQQVSDHGLTAWFQPDLRVQRQAAKTDMTGPFLDVAKESEVIQRGDLIHVDFGLDYMGLSTDWQKMAYVLKPGEKAAPAGLQAALKNTNKLQDIIFSIARAGMTGGDVYSRSIAKAKQEGIEASIYSHPLGFQGHGLGPSIDFRGSVGGGASKILPNSIMSIELNTATAVPEWGGQKVTMMAEDDAVMTSSGYQFIRPRQTELYIIK